MAKSIAPRWKARGAGLLAILFWGASFVWIKAALRELEPVSLLTIRFAIGAIVTWILALRTSAAGPPLTFRTLLSLAGLGAIGVFGHQWLQTTGMQSAGASEAAWLPAFLALLGWPLLGERLGAAQVAGLALGFLGAGLVATSSVSGNLARDRLGERHCFSAPRLPGRCTQSLGNGTCWTARLCTSPRGA